ncbi:MAG: acyl-CoA dehydrogenase family protein [Actinobacteria bacterium]|nr:acyl-CoA dehydrogenase family protein [Actinomycetota bacterium]
MTMTQQRLLHALDDLGAVPLPGAGETARRLRALADLGSGDLAVARLVEGHLDAVAILAEAAVPSPDGLLGVWAADPPAGRVDALRRGDGWALHGTKQWCSGAGMLDHALMTAHAADGYRLFHLPLASVGVGICQQRWQAVGMRDSATFDVVLDDAALCGEAAVGPPGWYLQRRGFWIGGIGVAACWYGGAVGALRSLRDAVCQRRDDPHGVAHLGAADALCAAMWAVLEAAADAIDDGLDGEDLRYRARQVRAVVERLATDVLCHAERGIGAAGLTRDPAMARRAADLPVYLRQHHAEADLAALGAAVLKRR